MKKRVDEPDLFAWADSRPSAVILDARPIIDHRIREYLVWMVLNDVEPDVDEHAEILPFSRNRGAA